MADLQAALRTRIVAATDAGVHWNKVPQNAPLPYVRLQTISDPRPDDLKAYRSSRMVRVQVDVFSSRYGEARSISEAIITATGQPETVGGVNFGRTRARGPIDGGDDTPNGFIHRLRTDLLAEHSIA